MQTFKVDRRPLHVQVYRYLTDLIEDGTYGPGEQLPSEADLAAQLGISRPTLREALLNLEQDGIIDRRHGVGTFVAPRRRTPLESGLERLESILDLSTRQRMTTSVRGLRVEQIVGEDSLAETLALDAGTPVTCVRRTIAVDGSSAAYLVDYVPSATLPPDVLDASFQGSILDLLMKRSDVRVHEALSEITALGAEDEIAEQLQIEPGDPLLLFTETLFDDHHTPVEFSRNFFVPDQFRFHVIRR
jgi:GntR family transcriptional regulator